MLTSLNPRNSRKAEATQQSDPKVTPKVTCLTMEMNGGSSAPHLACTPCVPLFVHCLIRVEAEGLLDYQGRAGIVSMEPSPGHIRCRTLLLNHFSCQKATCGATFSVTLVETLKVIVESLLSDFEEVSIFTSQFAVRSFERLSCQAAL